jgi:plastocyanin
VYRVQVSSAEEVTMARRPLHPLAAVLVVLAAIGLTAAPPAAAGAGCHRPPTEGRDDTLTLTELCFSPTVLRAAPRARLTIVNGDDLDHPLGRPGGAWAWDGGAGDRTTVQLGTSGVYPFFCYLHPGMVGVVVVGDGGGSGGATVVDVAAPGPASGAGAAGRPAGTAPVEASVPPAWLVVVALAALLGALGGTRLAARRRS